MKQSHNVHVNGFLPFDGSSDGLEKQFELGIKFQEVEHPDEFTASPLTGTKAHAEPILALYVSARLEGSPDAPLTLHYALPRRCFSADWSPNESDRHRLLKEARDLILADLRGLAKGTKPLSSQKFRAVFC